MQIYFKNIIQKENLLISEDIKKIRKWFICFLILFQTNIGQKSNITSLNQNHHLSFVKKFDNRLKNGTD